MTSRITRRRQHRGFTLIELLVVVSIIALLLAILLPSVARSREQARIVKCLSNMRSMSNAALMFTLDHRGYAQLVGSKHEWEVIDPDHSRYAYQAERTIRRARIPGALKAWPIAYASHLGIPSLRYNEDYFDSVYEKNPARYFNRYGRHEIFICPSDKNLVNNVFFPSDMYGILSYSPNEDIFGVTDPVYSAEGQPWKDGQSGDTNPPRCKRLEGRMDRIVRPSEVVLFCDGGKEDADQEAAMLITNGAVHGPYLENYERVWGRLPHYRHSPNGGLAVTLSDGSGKYVKPVEWVTIDGIPFVKRYAPRVRVSPYEVGPLSDTQP